MVAPKNAAVISILGLALGAGCKARPTVDDQPPAASAPVTVTSGTLPLTRPVPAEKIQQNINPGNLPAYAGPAGVVRGVVRATGDAPLDDVALPENRPAECLHAKDTYGKVFREGPDRTLADVLVAVTGYDKKFVPPVGDGPLVTMRQCAFDTRTIALTFGQVVSVLNKGGQALIPDLLGESTKALLVAMPGGSPVTVYPSAVGHYGLVDESHNFARADVFVLRFSTIDVTGLDGKFEIGRVPVGEVKVSAYLPATGKTVEKVVTVSADAPADISFEVPFDAASYRARGAEVAPAGSASSPSPAAAPSGSAPRAGSSASAGGP